MSKRIDWQAVLNAVGDGATLEQAAARVGVSGRTLERRIKADPMLAELVSEARPVRQPRHGLASTYAHGCRCTDCREAHRIEKLRRVAERRRGPTPASVQHGKATTYSNWSCRCDACSAAHSVQCRENGLRRAEALRANPDLRPHGTVATYGGWGCRCDACTEAIRIYQRDRNRRVTA